MGSSGPALRRKLTAIFAVIALSYIALCAPVFTSGVGEGGVRLRTVGLPHVGLAAKDPERKLFGALAALPMAEGGLFAPSWRDGGLLPSIVAGEWDWTGDAPTARGPPAIVSLA